MVQQLLPLLRFDGYHLLADLAGVPDLYQRIRPTLLGLLPAPVEARRRTACSPRARARHHPWVLVTVPLMALCCGRWSAPCRACWAAPARPSREDTRALGAAWSGGSVVDVAAHVLQVLAVVLPVVGVRHDPRPDGAALVARADRVEPGLGGQARGRRRAQRGGGDRAVLGLVAATPAPTARSSPASVASSPASCRRPRPRPDCPARSPPRTRRRRGPPPANGSPTGARWWPCCPRTASCRPRTSRRWPWCSCRRRRRHAGPGPARRGRGHRGPPHPDVGRAAPAPDGGRRTAPRRSARAGRVGPPGPRGRHLGLPLRQAAARPRRGTTRPSPSTRRTGRSPTTSRSPSSGPTATRCQRQRGPRLRLLLRLRGGRRGLPGRAHQRGRPGGRAAEPRGGGQLRLLPVHHRCRRQPAGPHRPR